MAKAEFERGQVRAPISGVVSDVPVETGQALQANDVVAEIIALDPMLAVVEVAERQLAGVEIGDRGDRAARHRRVPRKARCASSRRPRAKARAPTASTSSSTTRTARSPTASPPRSAFQLAPVEAVQIAALRPHLLRRRRCSACAPSTPTASSHTLPVADRRGRARRGLGRRLEDGARIIVQGQDFVKDGQMVEAVETAGAPALISSS